MFWFVRVFEWASGEYGLGLGKEESVEAFWERSMEDVDGVIMRRFEEKGKNYVLG